MQAHLGDRDRHHVGDRWLYHIFGIWYAAPSTNMGIASESIEVVEIGLPPRWSTHADCLCRRRLPARRCAQVRSVIKFLSGMSLWPQRLSACCRPVNNGTSGAPRCIVSKLATRSFSIPHQACQRSPSKNSRSLWPAEYAFPVSTGRLVAE